MKKWMKKLEDVKKSIHRCPEGYRLKQGSELACEVIGGCLGPFSRCVHGDCVEVAGGGFRCLCHPSFQGRYCHLRAADVTKKMWIGGLVALVVVSMVACECSSLIHPPPPHHHCNHTVSLGLLIILSLP